MRLVALGDRYANLLADPRSTLHLKRFVTAHLPAVARPIVEPRERRRILERIAGVRFADEAATRAA